MPEQNTPSCMNCYFMSMCKVHDAIIKGIVDTALDDSDLWNPILESVAASCFYWQPEGVDQVGRA